MGGKCLPCPLAMPLPCSGKIFYQMDGGKSHYELRSYHCQQETGGQFFCRFSLLKQPQGEQGPQSKSNTIAKNYQISKIEASQSDGLIEQFNPKLLQMLATCIDNHSFQWDHFFFCLKRRHNCQLMSCMHDIPTDVCTLPIFVQTLKRTLSEALASVLVCSENANGSSTTNQQLHGFPHQLGVVI